MAPCVLAAAAAFSLTFQLSFSSLYLMKNKSEIEGVQWLYTVQQGALFPTTNEAVMVLWFEGAECAMSVA
jgi:hypothetical protein